MKTFCLATCLCLLTSAVVSLVFSPEAIPAGLLIGAAAAVSGLPFVFGGLKYARSFLWFALIAAALNGFPAAMYFSAPPYGEASVGREIARFIAIVLNLSLGTVVLSFLGARRWKDAGSR